jgi:signal transduction histidine kinase
VRDITARKKVEAELRQALEIEKELNELKTNFISMVSHEFRTPLSVIMSSSELLTHYLDRMNEEKRANHLVRIKQQVIRLTNLVDDVLTISRAETTGLSFEPRVIDLRLLSESIVEEVLSGFDPGYTVEFAPPDSCDQCFIDVNLFRHIFQNLVSNALKYSHPQGTITINMDCNDEAVILTVRDYGIGIPEEHQKNLFQTFHRASNVGNIQGTGLGLSIVKRSVDKHGGTIDFESVENEGTTFTVILPNARPLD